jgi:hypothetical protein
MKKANNSKQTPKSSRQKAPTATPPQEASPEAELFALLGWRCEGDLLTSDDGVTPLPRGKRLYAFDLGDPQVLGVAAVIRVYADNKREALRRARALADNYFGGTDLISGTSLYDDNLWLDSFRIYSDGNCIRLEDGREESDSSMRPCD